VAPVVQKAVPLNFQAIGSAEAYSNVVMHAQITGELTSVGFKEGDDVKEGQVLFTLDQRPLAAALAQAEANLQRDLAQAANAQAQAQRYQDLASRGIATREQVDTSAAGATALQATVGADRAAVENARVQLQYATIKAPISGRTGALMVHTGNLVRANDVMPLVVINQITPIYVSFAIPEARLPDLKRYMGQGSTRVEVQPPNDVLPPTAGSITFVDNAVDQTTGTVKVKASFGNTDRRLWPGQFLNVTVTFKTDMNAIVVPSAAVQAGQQGNYVFVVKPDQTADMRAVEVERTAGDESIIKSGLKPGETVVTDGQLRLVPGSRVQAKDAVKGIS
jgi:multidrug efflux system membrane fusion protein